jgi:hypothetical protein
MRQKRPSSITNLIFLWIPLFMLSPCFAQEVKIEKKDGVTIVHNPKEPVKKLGAPSSLEFNQDLCIGNSPTDENYMFSPKATLRFTISFVTISGVFMCALKERTIEGASNGMFLIRKEFTSCRFICLLRNCCTP